MNLQCEYLLKKDPERIEELVNWGAQFDQTSGRFVFGREGAHSQNRILHAGDATGKEIVRALLNWVRQTSGIEIISHRPAVNLIIQNGTCMWCDTDGSKHRRKNVLRLHVRFCLQPAGLVRFIVTLRILRQQPVMVLQWQCVLAQK